MEYLKHGACLKRINKMTVWESKIAKIIFEPKDERGEWRIRSYRVLYICLMTLYHIYMIKTSRLKWLGYVERRKD